MLNFILSAILITEDNRRLVSRVYGQRLVRRYPLGFQVGIYVVTQTIELPDPFRPGKTNTHEETWLCTKDEFDTRFDVVSESEHGSMKIVTKE
jgi:hypothetical protein